LNKEKPTETTVRGPWLHTLRAAWLIIAVLIIGLWIAGTLVLVRTPNPDCNQTLCDNIDITAGDVEAAVDLGIPRGLTQAAA